MRSRSMHLVWALVLAGCAGSQVGQENSDPAQSFQGFSDTTWELHELQTGDDDPIPSQEVARDTYLLSFKPDGAMTFRVDCNRGFGKWKEFPAPKANQGTIELTEMGVTKAMCAPDSISDTVVGDMSRFDAFVINDGELQIATKDGNRTYKWRPHEGEIDTD